MGTEKHGLDGTFYESQLKAPCKNGLDESLNGKLRDEYLKMKWFRTRTKAKVVTETWRKEYNYIRPYSILEYQTPNEYNILLPNSASQQAVL